MRLKYYRLMQVIPNDVSHAGIISHKKCET